MKIKAAFPLIPSKSRRLIVKDAVAGSVAIIVEGGEVNVKKRFLLSKKVKGKPGLSFISRVGNDRGVMIMDQNAPGERG